MPAFSPRAFQEHIDYLLNQWSRQQIFPKNPETAARMVVRGQADRCDAEPDRGSRCALMRGPYKQVGEACHYRILVVTENPIRTEVACLFVPKRIRLQARRMLKGHLKISLDNR